MYKDKSIVLPPTAKDVINYIDYLYRNNLLDAMLPLFLNSPSNLQLKQVSNWIKIQDIKNNKIDD